MRSTVSTGEDQRTPARELRPVGGPGALEQADLELPKAVSALADYVRRLREHPTATMAGVRASRRQADRAGIFALYGEVLVILTA
jgi:hypothetical protein